MNRPQQLPFDPLDDMAEQRIELMLAAGRKIMLDAIEQYKPVAIFAGFSGGNDSIVATHFACTEFGATAIHANTGIGIEQSREHARNTAKKQGWEFYEKLAPVTGPPARTRDGRPFDPSVLPTGRWHDGDTKYEEFCFNFGMPGPGQHPRMYQVLKERTFEAYRREAKQGHSRRSTVIFVTGVRHDESAIRAGYQRAVSKVGGSVWVNPFYWQTKVDFEIYREEFGLPRNPVTDTVGMSGECLCGTMGTRAELDAIAKVEPETVAYIHKIESKCESLGLPCLWATRPPRKPKQPDVDPLQLSLFGDEPTFQPACVGCIRRGNQ
jgi:3'-phosphoadenosine 5'-phosphosulfate sulfotransferase (PAPS reductase)/FAD synthetase